MDTQRKKGVLEVCVLSVLKRGPSYGYQIIQDVSDCIEVTDSTMYLYSAATGVGGICDDVFHGA